MQTFPSLDVRPEVAAVLQTGRPVAALASGPIAHTLPWPTNLETVRLAEAAARQEGVVLAVVAVLNGRPTVGLDAKEIEMLWRGGIRLRASRRDLPTAVALGKTMATTVSASMYLAWRAAGIRLLASGAIGGVASVTERADGHTWDVADLIELSKTPVAVVNSGARSVHSVDSTAEILETFRVPVIGYETDSFPIFYMRVGNHPLPARADTPAQVAALLAAHWGMDGAGAVVVQPTPAEFALSPDELVPALRAVEEQAAKDGVPRQGLSPFLMEKLNRLTRGKALRAYQAILIANARRRRKWRKH